MTCGAAKIVKYPNVSEVSSSQGVGPHYDGGKHSILCSAVLASAGVLITLYHSRILDLCKYN